MSFFFYPHIMNEKWRKLRWKKKNREEGKEEGKEERRGRKKGRKGRGEDLDKGKSK